jgi:hypothetical protein
MEILLYPNLPAGFEPPELGAFCSKRAQSRRRRAAEQWIGCGFDQEQM